MGFWSLSVFRATSARYVSDHYKRRKRTEESILEESSHLEYREKASLNTLQKNILVWTGRYNSVEDIPEKVRVDVVGNSFSKIFALGYIWYVLFIIVVLYIPVVMWRREWKKGVADELRNTLIQRDGESENEYESRFQDILKKDIHFLRCGFINTSDMAAWGRQDMESELHVDPKKFSAQRERMKEKHLDTQRKEAMRQYVTETDGDWEKRMEQQLKQFKK